MSSTESPSSSESSESSSSSESFEIEPSQLTVGELKELIEMNIKALYASNKVRLFLVKRVEKRSGRVLYEAGVATFPSTKEPDVFLRSSDRRFTIESALEDILDQTMAELSEEVLFPEWCIKELNGYREKAIEEAFAIGQPSKVALAHDVQVERAVRLKELIQSKFNLMASNFIYVADLPVNVAALYASMPVTKIFVCKRDELYVAGVATPHTCGHGSVLLKSIERTTVEGALESLLEETAKELTKEMNF
ncbi:hypothetical protein FACUT_6031 [Fusarium acutatum]|uniref:Uncharacterized protein n=1 Tax=Fusarium acutatum TaxID=78861 RepID=A0A8H4JRK7_9HYPO|nr:hypothetical protein FACUT_6031 [Fusarium acutatum]